ncbi:MAG: hypothetical protein C5B50_27760 [Verrucomicrobia bacterium]|nr:MAG: hypothetical protein C5B50_27760 [Verrucomicrobiota bacterium]
MVYFVTLTLELSELRSANEKALEQLGRANEEQFDLELTEIENFLLSLYRFAVLSVKTEREMARAAEIWRETLDLISSSAAEAQTAASQHPGDHPSLPRIIAIRDAASDMLALYE